MSPTSVAAEGAHAGLRRASGHDQLHLPRGRRASRGTGRARGRARSRSDRRDRPQQLRRPRPRARHRQGAGPAPRARRAARLRLRPLAPRLADRPAGLRAPDAARLRGPAPRAEGCLPSHPRRPLRRRRRGPDGRGPRSARARRHLQGLARGTSQRLLRSCASRGLAPLRRPRPRPLRQAPGPRPQDRMPARGDGRRALPRRRAAALAGRPHLHPRACHPRPGGLASATERRAPPQGRGRDGAALRRPPGRAPGRPRDRRALRLLPRRARLRLPRARELRWPEPAAGTRAAGLGRGEAALSPRAHRQGRGADPPRAEAHRRARLRALFPHRRRHRPFRPLARHPLPGSRLGGELGGLLLPRRHRRRSGAHGSPLRTLRLGGP